MPTETPRQAAKRLRAATWLIGRAIAVWVNTRDPREISTITYDDGALSVTHDGHRYRVTIADDGPAASPLPSGADRELLASVAALDDIQDVVSRPGATMEDVADALRAAGRVVPHIPDDDPEYDHSRAKEDLRNAWQG
jgi:hypothetical protein